MCYYFADRPQYYNFIQALETENAQFRELHQKFAQLSTQSDKDFKTKQARINSSLNTIKPPVRNRVPALDGYSPKKSSAKKMKKINQKRCATSFQSFGNDRISPSARVTPEAMPARTNGSRRILSPSKLNKYKTEDRKQPALLIGSHLESDKMKTKIEHFPSIHSSKASHD